MRIPHSSDPMIPLLQTNQLRMFVGATISHERSSPENWRVETISRCSSPTSGGSNVSDVVAAEDYGACHTNRRKSAEEQRHSRPRGRSGMQSVASASWSAAVLCRFRASVRSTARYLGLVPLIFGVPILLTSAATSDMKNSSHGRELSTSNAQSVAALASFDASFSKISCT